MICKRNEKDSAKGGKIEVLSYEGRNTNAKKLQEETPHSKESFNV